MKRLTLLRFVCVALMAAGLSGCNPSDPDSNPPDTDTQASKSATSTEVVEVTDVVEGGEHVRSRLDPAARLDGPAPEPLIDEEARRQLVEILDDPDPFENARRLSELLPTWGPEQIPAARSVLTDPLVNVTATGFDLVMTWWASVDPAGAARFSVEKASLLYRLAAVLSTYGQWAKVDPTAALVPLNTWFDTYRDLNDVLPRALVRGWYAAGDPPELWAYISSESIGIFRQRLISTYVRTRLREEGPGPVTAWAVALPDSDQRLKLAVYRQMASHLPQVSLPAALEWCDQHCDGEYGADVRNIIARRWVVAEGGIAIEWLADRPESHDRNLGIRTAFAAWAVRDEPAALAWAGAWVDAGSPEWLAAIYPVYARRLAGQDPEAAIALAEQIEKENERLIVLTDVAHTWRSIDPVAADAWIEMSPLTAAQREQARKAKLAPLHN